MKHITITRLLYTKQYQQIKLFLLGIMTLALTQSAFGQIAFYSKTDIATGNSPYSVALGDINGDGNSDIAVANYCDATVSVFLNTTIPFAETATFSAKTDFAAGTGPVSVSIGDLNGDGNSDIAVANYCDATVSVFLNTTIPFAETPTFSAKANYAVGTSPISVSIGDFNGDGKNDMAVANRYANTVSVLLNTTASGVATPTFSDKAYFRTGCSPYSVSIGDFNGDGKNDIAVTNNGAATVSVLLNTTIPFAATPTFSAKTDFATGTSPISVSIGDFNGDGKNDMAVGNLCANTVSVLLNTTTPGSATSTFSAKVDFGTGTSPHSVSIGDLDVDGKNDIAVANRGDSTVSVLLNTTALGASTPSFSVKADFGTGNSPYSVSIGDLNGDGNSDMAVANRCANTVSVLLNTTPPPLPVELTSFTASVNNNAVALRWHTATEINNYGYEVERRTISNQQITQSSIVNWQKIGFVAGNGTSNSPKEYSYSDASGSTGSYVYRLKQIDQDGTFKYSDVVEVSFMKPAEYALDQNYPNPFNPSTTIKYRLPALSTVRLVIYNVLSQVVTDLVNTVQPAGWNQVVWNANVSSGLYFYRLEAVSLDNPSKRFVETKKMLLLR